MLIAGHNFAQPLGRLPVLLARVVDLPELIIRMSVARVEPRRLQEKAFFPIRRRHQTAHVILLGIQAHLRTQSSVLGFGRRRLRGNQRERSPDQVSFERGQIVQAPCLHELRTFAQAPPIVDARGDSQRSGARAAPRIGFPLEASVDHLRRVERLADFNHGGGRQVRSRVQV